jgi:2-iminobutanoate/2-iminopropanoate deaminase
VLSTLGGVIGSWRFAPAEGVPPAVAPFAHATAAGETLYVTGQMPTDLDGRLVDGGIATQTDQVMRNLCRVLELAGGALDDVVQVRAYLLEFDNDYAEFNAAYERWFPSRLPSRTCVGVSGLAARARVEVDLVAWRTGGWGRRVSAAGG